MQAKRSLYDISTDYSEFEDLLDRIDLDAISDEDQAQLDAFMADLEHERDVKLDGYGRFIKEREYIGKARTEEAKRIAKLGQIEMNKATYLKNRLLMFFESHGINETIQTLHFKFRKQANGGVAPLVMNEDVQPESLPERFVKTVLVIDREEIRAALEAGEQLAFAKLGEKGEHLRIS